MAKKWRQLMLLVDKDMDDQIIPKAMRKTLFVPKKVTPPADPFSAEYEAWFAETFRREPESEG